jgi:hypothetical protein
MKLLFVHGWSVTNTDTYGELPEALKDQAPVGLDLEIEHLYLSEYISFHDEVRVSDIAKAFESARKDVLGENTEFSCITHSTGAPVIRAWIERYFGADKLSDLPLKHLVMLAPANHGSSLAQLGKERVGRIKSWFSGVEPGQGVLNWLEFGSNEQLDLNLPWLSYNCVANNFFPVVLTGESIDEKFYDFLNSYLDEKGSDGVVRVAAANMNYRSVRLKQNTESDQFTVHTHNDQQEVYPLEIDGAVQDPPHRYAMEVIPKASHSGKKMGIMLSVTEENANDKPVISSILASLAVTDKAGYTALTESMAERTAKTQTGHTYTMVVIRVVDNEGNEIHDYDLLFLAGNSYHPGKLPKGFCVDRQKNSINNCQLTFYLDDTVMSEIEDNKIGFRVIPRPSEGFAHYSPAEFRSEDITASALLKGNETLLLEIELQRQVDASTLIVKPLKTVRDMDDKNENFKKRKPSKKIVK